MIIEIDIKQEEGFKLIKLKGEVDASSSIKLDEALQKIMKESNDHILVDCEQLEYISSPGIGVFNECSQDSLEQNRKLILFKLNDEVFEIFDIAGFTKIIPIATSFDQAKSLLENDS